MSFLVQGKANFNLYRILDLLYIIVFVLLIQRRPDPASVKNNIYEQTLKNEIVEVTLVKIELEKDLTITSAGLYF